MTGPSTSPVICVLGASGLLGTAVTREFAARPGRLRLVGRRSPELPPDPVAEVEVRTADLTVDRELRAAVADADVVLYLLAHRAGAGSWRSAEHDRAAERVNLDLTRDLVEAVRARRRPPLVLFAGSTSQVGSVPGGRIDGTEPDHPLTRYDRQKLSGERALLAAVKTARPRGISLRLGTLFGQDPETCARDRGVVATMLRRAAAGQPLPVWHNGAARRDLLCVDDAARAFVAAVDHADALVGRHWLVGSGVGTSIRDLFRAIADATARATGRAPVPVVSAAPPRQAVPTDQLDFVTDPSAFQAASGWRSRVPLVEGLDRAAVAVAGLGYPEGRGWSSV